MQKSNIIQEFERRSGMMTLDEAIKHCYEKADCSECGQEHKQLGEWLEELKHYKQLEETGR